MSWGEGPGRRRGRISSPTVGLDPMTPRPQLELKSRVRRLRSHPGSPSSWLHFQTDRKAPRSVTGHPGIPASVTALASLCLDEHSRHALADLRDTSRPGWWRRCSRASTESTGQLLTFLTPRVPEPRAESALVLLLGHKLPRT